MSKYANKVNYIEMYIDKWGDDDLPAYIDAGNWDTVNENCKQCLESGLMYSIMFGESTYEEGELL